MKLPVRARTWHSNTIEDAEGALVAEAAGPAERDLIIAAVNACGTITTELDRLAQAGGSEPGLPDIPRRRSDGLT